MTSITILLVSLILIVGYAQSLAPASSHESTGQKLILNAYLDNTGKALVTGYVQDISGLPFLNSSVYRYENDTMRLYALTDALTHKEGDVWRLELQSGGYYDDYHLTFYLPGEVGIKGINITNGLRYLLSISNQSLVMEIQGYDVESPVIAIKYQETLQDERARSSFFPFALAFVLLLSSSSAIYLIWKKTRKDSIPSFNSAQISEASEPGMEIENAKNAKNKVDEVENGSDREKTRELAEDAIKNEIKITSEMKAVMETLTPRERAILETLIKAGGRMNQSDLMYETGTPKSSLSGILLSLERRRIIIKDKSSHKNVIELSDWFLSKKELY